MIPEPGYLFGLEVTASYRRSILNGLPARLAGPVPFHRA